MYARFEIRPVGLDEGFAISCEGVLEKSARQQRLIDAIVHAALIGRDLDGEIQIFDTTGRLSEALPLPRTPALAD